MTHSSAIGPVTPWSTLVGRLGKVRRGVRRGASRLAVVRELQQCEAATSDKPEVRQLLKKPTKEVITKILNAPDHRSSVASGMVETVKKKGGDDDGDDGRGGSDILSGPDWDTGGLNRRNSGSADLRASSLIIPSQRCAESLKKTTTTTSNQYIQPTKKRQINKITQKNLKVLLLPNSGASAYTRTEEGAPASHRPLMAHNIVRPLRPLHVQFRLFPVVRPARVVSQWRFMEVNRCLIPAEAVRESNLHEMRIMKAFGAIRSHKLMFPLQLG
ncbi:hypothetical protein PoB_006573200 [Plakobranchus ocellatus]|uniref:Uncharacterized protein n=1 Tax=Plakobranchus ocellatus TaxID=259542 RepID=A0AAV4D4U0_9GAST|nr:hypothetical protein PoB_006573200 [Plakobranchus ocellatus]